MKSVGVLLLGALGLALPLTVTAQSGCVYQDDFEPAQDSGWAFDVAVNETLGSSTWEARTDPRTHSATNAMFSDGADPSGAKDDRLIAPAQDLTADSHLIFYHYYTLESGFDGGVLEVSTDGGANWVDVIQGGGVFVEGGYTDTIDGSFGSHIGGRQAWTGFTEHFDAMVRVEVDLGAFAGKGVLVRWRLSLDDVTLEPGTEGWYIDDVQFTNLDCDPPDPPGPESPCKLPGITVATDPTGDYNQAGSSNQDVQAVWISELAANTDAPTFTMKVADLGTIPASAKWFVYFTGANGTEYFASMETDAASAASFKYGYIDAQGILRTSGDADSGSYTPDGYIHITVSTSKIGAPAVGDKLTSFHGGTARFVGVGGNGGTLTIDSATPGTTEYALKGNAFCGLPGETVCLLPGLTVLTDPAGDANNQQAAHDARKLSIAEPYDIAPDKIMFVLTMANLGTLPPNTRWPVQFSVDGVVRVAQMTTVPPASPTAPAFQLYTGTISAFQPTVQAIDPASGYDPGGAIRLVVRRSSIGNPAIGSDVKDFLVRVVVEGQAFVVYPDNMPNSFTPTGSHTIVGNEFCAPNALPQASLSADKQLGDAPLTVQFTVGGSDADGELTAFTLDFGDGQKLQAQPFDGQVPLLVPHTYQDAGDYVAALTVTDDQAAASTNLTEVPIDVSGPPVARAGEDIEVDEGAVVTLDGSNSNDGNADALSFSWTQPSGPSVTLTGDSTDKPTFKAPQTCASLALTFRLMVGNSAGTDTDDVTVTIRNINQPPVASAGEDKVVSRGQFVTLSAANSQDADSCQTLTYQWTQLSGPPVTLSDSTAIKPTFVAPEVDGDTPLTFQVRTEDSAGADSAALVTITVSGDPVGFTKILGGSVPLGSLAVLSLLAGLARRRR